MEDGAHRVPQLEPPTAGCTTARNMGDRLMTARYSHGAPGSYRFRLCIPALCVLAFSLGLATTPARGQAPAIPNPVRPGLTAQTTENTATATTGAATNFPTGTATVGCRGSRKPGELNGHGPNRGPAKQP